MEHATEGPPVMASRTDTLPLYSPRNIVATAVQRVRLAERYYVGGTTVTRRTCKHHLDAVARMTDYGKESSRAGWTRCGQLRLAIETGGYVRPATDTNGRPITEDGRPFTRDDYDADERRRAGATRIVRRVLDVLAGLGVLIIDRNGRLNHYRIDLQACEALRMTDTPVNWRDDVPAVWLRLQDCEDAEQHDSEPNSNGETNDSPLLTPDDRNDDTDRTAWNRFGRELAAAGVSLVADTIDRLRERDVSHETAVATLEAYASRSWCEPKHLVQRLRNCVDGQDQNAADLWPRDPTPKPIGSPPAIMPADHIAARQQQADELDRLNAAHGADVDAMSYGEQLAALKEFNHRLANRQRQRGRQLLPAARSALLIWLDRTLATSTTTTTTLERKHPA